LDETDWLRLIDQLTNGDCTPFLGAGACDGTLPSGPALSRDWATACHYPFHDPGDLPKVMQYAAFTQGDSTYLKQLVCRKLATADPPDFTAATEPHAMLAQFPLPVFLTTNYDDFLLKALQSAGKRPQTAICHWYDPPPHRPGQGPEHTVTDANQPLVYHLHGSWSDARSLVLTQRDYLDFLVNVSVARGDGSRRLLPSSVLTALTSKPLLFIGYSLQDWTFLVLFVGLLRNIPDIHLRRSISVQLPPPVNGLTADAEERAKTYLQSYLEDWRISIFWGTAADFCTQLRDRIGGGT
jgi:hypothetical protein